MESSSEAGNDEVTCWVCFHLMEPHNATTLPCNHSFCRPCTQALLNKDAALCPFCRAPYRSLPPPAASLLALLAARDPHTHPSSASASTSASSVALRLNRDEWRCVLRLVGPQALCRVSQCCTTLRTLSADGPLWREQCLRDFPFALPKRDDPGGWKAAYGRAVRCGRGWKTGAVKDWQLKSMRADLAEEGDHENPSAGHVAALRWAGPDAVFAAYKGAVPRVRRWNSEAQRVWTSQSLPAAPIALLGPCGDLLWVHCAVGALATVDAESGVVRCVVPLGLSSGLTPVLSAMRCVYVAASGNVIHWTDAQGAQLNAVAQPSVHSLVAVACGTAAVDENGVSLYSPHAQLLYRVSAAEGFPAGPNGKAFALNQRLIAFVTLPGPALSILDTETRIWTVSNHGLDNDLMPFMGALNVLFGDSRIVVTTPRFADIYPMIHGGALGPRTHRFAQDTFNAWELNGRTLIGATQSNAIRVYDVHDGTSLYALLGGSMQIRQDNPPHPSRPGCSFVSLQHHGVVGSFNAVLKLWTIKE